MAPDLGFIARRAVRGAVTLVVSSLVVFGALYLAPGSPVDALLGNRPATPELTAQLRDQYGLDDSFLERYLDWVGGALHGDLGRSALLNQEVGDLIANRLPTTLLLVAMTLVTVLVLGVAAGALAAVRRGTVDDAVVATASVASATPSFVSAALLTSVFAVGLQWFPVFGVGDGLLDRMYHLVLPTVAMAGAWFAIVAQTTRAAVMAEMDHEHVETARSRGLAPSVVFRRHVMRNAAAPVVTVGGLALASLVATSAIVEVAFQLNGVGSLLVTSVTSRDFPVVQAVCLMLVAAFIVINTVVEMAARALDPRLRLQGGLA